MRDSAGSMHFSFEGQTVIVTGAARGIGRELAVFFRAAGAVTYAIDTDEDPLRELDGLGVRTRSVDVASTNAVETMVAAVIEESGRIDVLVNNAGIVRDSWLGRMSDEDWDQVLAVHLGGTFRLTRACLPHFRASSYGRVINLTSYAGLHGNPGQANYATAKAGIIGFTKTVAKELAGFGVTVNAVSPNAATRLLDGIPPERRAEILRMIPAGRFADPAEICSAVGFLASAEAAYVTGIVLPVDGGLAI